MKKLLWLVLLVSVAVLSAYGQNILLIYDRSDYRNLETYDFFLEDTYKYLTRDRNMKGKKLSFQNGDYGLLQDEKLLNDFDVVVIATMAERNSLASPQVANFYKANKAASNLLLLVYTNGNGLYKPPQDVDAISSSTQEFPGIATIKKELVPKMIQILP